MASRLGATVLVALAALSFSVGALAEPSPADKETARALMSTGRQDRTKGDLQGALKAFVAADAIMRVPTTGLEVARSQVALGLLVEARDTALQVTRLPLASREPAPFKAAREAAAALSEDLLTRIPSLTVTVKNAPEGATPTVTIDGATLSAEAMDAPRKLNPGHHVVTAKAGPTLKKQDVELAEQETKSVAIELPTPESVAAASDENAQGAPLEEPTSGRSAGSKALLVGGFGVAGVGLIVGSITGALSLAKTSSIKGSSACIGNVCNPSEDGDLSSARTMATISTVSFIAAGVGAVVGVVGLLTGHGKAPASAEQQAALVWFEPTFGIGTVGVRGGF